MLHFSAIITLRCIVTGKIKAHKPKRHQVHRTCSPHTYQYINIATPDIGAGNMIETCCVSRPMPEVGINNTKLILYDR